MIAILTAALSGMFYGASDFCGALATTKNKATVVTFWAQFVSFVALGAFVVMSSEGTLLASDLAWGAVGGLGIAIGLVSFYQALAQGPMATAASVTALWGAAIPVVVGLALGERPGALTLAGIAIAVPATVLVSAGGLSIESLPTNTTPRDRVAGLHGADRTKMLSIVAGIGFGVFFVSLARTSPDGALYPLVGARTAALLALGVVATMRREWHKLDSEAGPNVVLAGVFDFAANAFYLIALRYGSFTWVAAISSLYPVSTVLLARIVLHERLARAQAVGLAMAGVALAMIAVGV